MFIGSLLILKEVIALAELLLNKKTKSTKVRNKFRKSNLFYGLLFTSPVLLGYTIFVFIPLIADVILSFTNFSMGANKVNFVGLTNYADMLSGRDTFFYPSVRATFYYVFASVPLIIVFSLFVAVLLNMKIKGRGFFRAVFYLPVVIPVASASIIWMWIFQPDFGVVNYLLGLLNIPKCDWLSSETTVIPTFILFALWSSGSTIIIFLAGLQQIPASLYEAIAVDGGNAWKKFIHVTLPMLSPIILFNTVIAFINGFQTFVQPMIMTSSAQQTGAMGGPNNASLLFVLYIYQQAFRFSRMGAASAAAVLLLIVIMIFTYLIFRFSKSAVYYEGGAK